MLSVAMPAIVHETCATALTVTNTPAQIQGAYGKRGAQYKSPFSSDPSQDLSATPAQPTEHIGPEELTLGQGSEAQNRGMVGQQWKG
ncbi:unnamed protein product [Protopolystoma xenopodis]|uniref:Uncharacterized protein n=1 Tax=Protopolystoma xenopodis TaxID=117903 RepID=A0A3S5AAV5_9PLAT|nr:unnamed protein product [Protopolystoma xenopodis]